MEYVELNISVADDEQSEIMMALLAEYPFEAFDEQDGTLRAYIQTSEWEQCCQEVEAMLREAIPCKDVYIGLVGPIVGASVGPSVVGFWAFGKEVTFVSEG